MGLGSNTIWKTWRPVMHSPRILLQEGLRDIGRAKRKVSTTLSPCGESADDRMHCAIVVLVPEFASRELQPRHIIGQHPTCRSPICKQNFLARREFAWLLRIGVG